MGKYVYVKDGFETLFIVGFFDPRGVWWPESDHQDKEDAAARVAWLNGSSKLMVPPGCICEKFPAGD